MRIIPVLDLKSGLVVHARLGDRANYRPIETPLAPSADPVAVMAGLITLHPFGTVYIADLDAIEDRGDNNPAVERIADAFPHLEIWLDAGASAALHADAETAHRRIRPVLGTESQTETAPAGIVDPAVLSLDFRGDVFLGPDVFLTSPDLWPTDVIVMTLARVGSGAGPDFDRLAVIRDRAGPGRRVFAAGGVRSASDLDRLDGMGIAGALVATALHDGSLSPTELKRFGPSL